MNWRGACPYRAADPPARRGRREMVLETQTQTALDQANAQIKEKDAIIDQLRAELAKVATPAPV